MSDGVGIGLLVRAALPAVPGVNLLPGIRKSGSDDLEGLTFSTRPIEVRREHVHAYAAVCGFPDKDTVPLTYPHVLGFPLHLKVMTDPAFPFPAIGGVHLTNTITTPPPDRRRRDPRGHGAPREPPAARQGPHRRLRHRRDQRRRARLGGPVDVPAPREGEPRRPEQPVFDEVEPSGITWRLPGDLGRRYAAVSGDRNPIHLYPWTAKALGFKRQIAHGMWTKARCVAALENRLPDAVTVEVAFKKPVFLPGTVAFASRPTDTGFAFSLTSPASGAPHLQGRATRVD